MQFHVIIEHTLLYRPMTLAALGGGFLFGLIYRQILIQIFPTTIRGQQRNILTYGRIGRALAGFVLIIIAILTNWSPVLFFIAGFCFFEAIFSRCGWYAALGKTSCPL